MANETQDRPDIPAQIAVEREAQKQAFDHKGQEILKPIIDDIRLFGMVGRTLSEMKHILDHPGEYDLATFQTMKHHLEDMELFLKYAQGRMVALGRIKSLPPVAAQQERGY